RPLSARDAYACAGAVILVALCRRARRPPVARVGVPELLVVAVAGIVIRRAAGVARDRKGEALAITVGILHHVIRRNIAGRSIIGRLREHIPGEQRNRVAPAIVL